MTKLDQLKERVSETFTTNAALWFSGGKDSLLLYHVARSLGVTVNLLRFDDGWSALQKNLVYKLLARERAALYSYRPVRGMMVGNANKDTAFISFYPIGPEGQCLPVIRDMVHGERCSFDVGIRFENDRVTPPVRFKTHVLGTKRTDRHFIWGDLPLAPSDRMDLGYAVLDFPLYEWTDDEVVDVLRQLNIPYEKPSETRDTGNIAACTACLRPGVGPVFCPKAKTDIERVEWSPTANLEAARKIIGVPEQ